MARLTMSDGFNSLPDWSGRLLQAESGTTILAHTARSFSYRLPADSNFADFTVRISGTGFKYELGKPVSGDVNSLEVLDATGKSVVKIDQVNAKSLGNDLALLVDAIFGWSTPDDDQSPDGFTAWSFLLSGDDVVVGTGGSDRTGVPGLNLGNDLFDMLGGDDTIWGNSGSDTIFGGDGLDRIDFSNTSFQDGTAAFRGISVDTTDATAKTIIDCWGFTDSFDGIEEIRGSRFVDSYRGGASRDVFYGLRGADTLYGGGDQDEMRYDRDTRNGGALGIVADLQTGFSNGMLRGVIKDGFGNTDIVFDVERVTGTRYDDVIVGSAESNSFWGGEGKDSFDGDGGFDRISFTRRFTSDPQVGVHVDLSRATGNIVNDGFGNTETAISIEWIEGSSLNDLIIGNGATNRLDGTSGKDTLTGNGGADEFVWDGAGELGSSDIITDFKATGPGADTLTFYAPAYIGMTTVLTLVNGTAATQEIGTFVFNSANQTLYWDSDGSGANAALAVAVLNGVTKLVVGDFLLYE